MQRIDLASLVFGFVAMLAVGLVGAPAGASAKVMLAAAGCAVLMRFVGPLPALAIGGLAKVVAGLGTKAPDTLETTFDVAMYVGLAGTAVGLAFAVRAWLFA